jgi:ferritin-like metal-binding protein YciE
MAEVERLHDALIDELKDLLNAEKQMSRALPTLAKNATNPKLRQALRSHLKETNAQARRLERALRLLDEKVEGKLCDGMMGIIKEGNKMLKETAKGPVLDAVIIAGSQRAEHYEIGAYGTCLAWAEQMGHREVARLLKQTLNEEKAADKKLSAIAESSVNEAANFGMDEDEEDAG